MIRALASLVPSPPPGVFEEPRIQPLSVDAPPGDAATQVAEALTRFDIFEGYVGVLAVSFLVSVLATPLVRRIAVANGVIDKPDATRKTHGLPIAYLGGLAVYLGIIAGICLSYFAVRIPGVIDFHQTEGTPAPVPLSVVVGLTIIMLIGLIDDVSGISPRVKVGGQLLAAAALAYDTVGVRVAEGLVMPFVKQFGLPTFWVPEPWAPQLSAGQLAQMSPTQLDLLADNIRQTFGVMFQTPEALIPLLGDTMQLDLVYWIGTAIIAVFVIGGCNASNLIDGLDGLLSGVTAIAVAGLLIVALGLAVVQDGERDAQRIVLCLAVLGACLGFLPHNFNPAVIFLGDAGSLMLGYITVVIILTLGDTGRTDLVFAGLIIFGIPIVDTALAIVRRKMAGRRMSDPDSNHLHHMLKRAFGVKGAVLSLYVMGIAFAALGVAVSEFRARAVYAVALVLFAYVGVWAIKVARREHIEAEARAPTPRQRSQGKLGKALADRAHIAIERMRSGGD